MSVNKKGKSKIYLKRIISDIAEIVSDPVENIHIWYDENNITNIKALIIGPKDTPYNDGFYFFTLDFPETYPFDSPKAKFETINQIIRFNPNLYEGGKVCLSILGTWSGPKWSSVQTLKSVLLSIQSLLNENPINNEPGWENSKNDDVKSVQYNEYIQYYNYEFAIMHVLEYENFFPFFNKVIQKYFVDNYEKLLSYLEQKKHLDDKTMTTFIWNHSVKVNYTELIKRYVSMYQKLKDIDFNDEDSSKESNLKNVNI